MDRMTRRFGVVIALCAAGVLASCGNTAPEEPVKQTTTSRPAETTVTTTSTTTTTPVSTTAKPVVTTAAPTTAEPPTTVPVTAPPSVGSAELDGWRGTILTVTDPASPADPADAPGSGNRLVLIEVDVMNISDASAPTVGECFELADSNGNAYPHVWLSDPAAGNLSAVVEPGKSVRGPILFEVPESADGLTANFNCDWVTPAPVSISLG